MLPLTHRVNYHTAVCSVYLAIHMDNVKLSSHKGKHISTV